MSNFAVRRIPFVDALRGFALLLMVLNHTAVHLLDQSLDPVRHYLVYLTVSLSAPLFLFLVGFSSSLHFYRGQTAQPDKRSQQYWRYLRRGFGLILSGYALNYLVAPQAPPYSGGILQTIGMGTILAASIMRWLDQRKFRIVLVFIAFMSYLLFVFAHPGLASWLVRHPVMSHLFFAGFPPWPWISMMLIGLIFGYRWVEVEGQVEGVRRYLVQIKVSGMIFLAIYFLINATHGQIVNFNLQQDYIINGHWLPGSHAIFWIFGMIFTGFAVMYRMFVHGNRYLQWLVILGQSALLLYVIHLLIIVGISDRLLGLRINQWWQFIVSSVSLVVALVFIASRYRLLKQRPQLL
jgi:uncharacterized membrane protein